MLKRVGSTARRELKRRSSGPAVFLESLGAGATQLAEGRPRAARVRLPADLLTRAWALGSRSRWSVSFPPRRERSRGELLLPRLRPDPRRGPARPANQVAFRRKPRAVHAGPARLLRHRAERAGPHRPLRHDASLRRAARDLERLGEAAWIVECVARLSGRSRPAARPLRAAGPGAAGARPEANRPRARLGVLRRSAAWTCSATGPASTAAWMRARLSVPATRRWTRGRRPGLRDVPRPAPTPCPCRGRLVACLRAAAGGRWEEALRLPLSTGGGERAATRCWTASWSGSSASPRARRGSCCRRSAAARRSSRRSVGTPGAAWYPSAHASDDGRARLALQAPRLRLPVERDLRRHRARCWDYGPLGVELKNNIKRLWWRDFVHQRGGRGGARRVDPHAPPRVGGQRPRRATSPIRWWTAASASTASAPTTSTRCRGSTTAPATKGNKFTIPAGEACEHCGERRTLCPECGKGELTEPRQFNLMFKTFMGPVEEDAAVTYLRPETAQAMFVNFDNVLQSMRRKLPFGIAQIGRAFRNEITPGNFIFRTREFEQMEIEFFVNPRDTVDGRPPTSTGTTAGSRTAWRWFQRYGLRAGEPPAPRAREGRAGALRQAHGGHRVPVPHRLERARWASPTAPTSTSSSTPR